MKHRDDFVIPDTPYRTEPMKLENPLWVVAAAYLQLDPDSLEPSVTDRIADMMDKLSDQDFEHSATTALAPVRGDMPVEAYTIKQLHTAHETAATNQLHAVGRAACRASARGDLRSQPMAYQKAFLRHVGASVFRAPGTTTYMSKHWAALYPGYAVPDEDMKRCLNWYGSFSTRSNRKAEIVSDPFSSTTRLPNLNKMMLPTIQSYINNGMNMTDVRTAFMRYTVQVQAPELYKRFKHASQLFTARAGKLYTSAYAFPECGNPRCIEPTHQRIVEWGEMLPLMLPIITLNENPKLEKEHRVPRKQRVAPPKSLPRTLGLEPQREGHPMTPIASRLHTDQLPIDDLPWGMVADWWIPILARVPRVAEHPGGLELDVPTLVPRRELWEQRAHPMHIERDVAAGRAHERARWGDTPRQEEPDDTDH